MFRVIAMLIYCFRRFEATIYIITAATLLMATLAAGCQADGWRCRHYAGFDAAADDAAYYFLLRDAAMPLRFTLR